MADADDAGRIEQWRGLPIREELIAAECSGWWLVEPKLGFGADGIFTGLDGGLSCCTSFSYVLLGEDENEDGDVMSMLGGRSTNSSASRSSIPDEYFRQSLSDGLRSSRFNCSLNSTMSPSQRSSSSFITSPYQTQMRCAAFAVVALIAACVLGLLRRHRMFASRHAIEQLADKSQGIDLVVEFACRKAKELTAQLGIPTELTGTYRPSSAIRPRIDCALTALSPRVGNSSR